MTNFFRRNQKKLLAIFAAGLMVVFILPGTCGQNAGRRIDPVVAYAGDEKIYASEIGNLRADWEFLKRIPTLAPRVAVMFGRSPFQSLPFTYRLGVLATIIDQHPELFFLMHKEAQKEGIKVAPERVDTVLRGELNISPNISADDSERLRRALTHFLAVESLVERVTSNVKISEPVVTRQLADRAQEVSLNLVEFTADSFKSATTAPTEEDLQAHFRKYADVAPGTPSTQPSALPFGYRYPNRVKLQYLTLDAKQVKEAVRKSKSSYDWEVAAQRYYQSHLKDFPVTQPVTTQATQPATASATRPTTRPFSDVREQVMERVMEPDVAALTDKIRTALSQRLNSDFAKYEAQHPTIGPSSAPATAPASTQATGFASFGYLEQLAADIQKEFGVLPAVTSKADQWLTADDLSNLPGIGSARKTTGRETLANYILQASEAFMPIPTKADPAARLSLFEPSQPLEDLDGNLYFFRLTDAQAAHPPQSLAEVRQQVESDVRNGRAYAKALEEAKKVLEAAKTSGLDPAAATVGRNVIATGSIDRFGGFGLGPTTIPNYPTEPAGRQEIVEQAYKLLSEATPESRHPRAIIELPQEKKVLVAELRDVTSRLQADRAYATRLGVARQMEFTQAQDLAAEYFTPDAVKARLGYRPLDEDRKDTRKTASAS